MRSRPDPIRTGWLPLLLTLLLVPMANAKDTPRAKPQATAGVEKNDGWPDTREGALGRRWVTAFREGDAAMRRFYHEDLAEASLTERSLEARISRYRDLREKFGSLTLGSVTKQSKGELTVQLLDADGRPHDFVFKAQTAAPFRLISVSMLQKQFGGHGGLHH